MSGRRVDKHDADSDSGSDKLLTDSADEIDRGPPKSNYLVPTRWKPRNGLPSLIDDEFLDLEVDKSLPIYEYTHGYPDTIVLKCDKCKRFARAEWNLPGIEIKPGPGDRGYSFMCSQCGGGQQQFEHTEKTWLDITLTCLYNLELADRDKGGNRFFHVRKEICGFADKHWESICKGRNRTATWWATLNAQITTRTDLFETVQHGSGKWALVFSNITTRKAPAPGSPSHSESRFLEGSKPTARQLALSTSSLRRGRSSAESGDESSNREYDFDEETARSPRLRRGRPRDVETVAPHHLRSRTSLMNVEARNLLADVNDLDDDSSRVVVARVRSGTNLATAAYASQDEDSPLLITPSVDLFSDLNMPTGSVSAPMRLLIRRVPKLNDSSSATTSTDTSSTSIDSPTDSQPWSGSTSDDSVFSWVSVPQQSTYSLNSLLADFDASNHIRIPLTDRILASAAQCASENEDASANSVDQSIVSQPTPVSIGPPKRAATPLVSAEPVPIEVAPAKVSAPAHNSVPTPVATHTKHLRSLGPIPSPRRSSHGHADSAPSTHESLSKSVEVTEDTMSPSWKKKRKASLLTRSMELTGSSTWSSPAPGVGGPRITIKDLIDTNTIEIGEELLFRNTGEPAIVHADGTIHWRGEIFYSPSTFAKTAARTLGLTSQGSFHNGWQYVFARGHPLTVFRDRLMSHPGIEREKIVQVHEEPLPPPNKRHRSHVSHPSPSPTVPSAPIVGPLTIEVSPPLVPIKPDASQSGTVSQTSPFDPSEPVTQPGFNLEELHSSPFTLVFQNHLHPPVNLHVQLSPSIIPPQPNFAALACGAFADDVDAVHRTMMDHHAPVVEQQMDQVCGFLL